MARPQRCRRICREPEYPRFTPDGVPCANTVVLSVDEFEALRLVDYEKMTHGQCAAQMDISRTTVTEIYESARHKVADSLVNGKRLIIAGGTYRLCDGSASCGGSACPKDRPRPSQETLPKKEGTQMRIAVTYENGQVFQHFGHTQQFKFYDVGLGRIFHSQVVDTAGSGHGALAGFLRTRQVDVLICGGIGPGAQNALAQAGIKLYGGVSGRADEAVEALMNDRLDYDPAIQCSHHGHGGDHACGSHGDGEAHVCGAEEGGHSCGGHSCH